MAIASFLLVQLMPAGRRCVKPRPTHHWRSGRLERILVVEDDRELAELLKFGLRLRGYLVEVAENGREALTILEQQSFDAIVLDWNMPALGGEQFLEQHRRRTASPLATPVVVMTARPDVEQKALELGAVAVVAKPFSLNELVRVLVSLLGDAE